MILHAIFAFGLKKHQFPTGFIRYFEGEFRDNRYHEGYLYWYYSDGVKKIRVEYNDGKVAEARMWNRNGEQRW